MSASPKPYPVVYDAATAQLQYVFPTGFIALSALVASSLTIGGTLDASSVVTLSSTTQGFLPPRMTTTQKNAITSPAEGLMVYDVSLHAPCVYNGSAWKTVTIS